MACYICEKKEIYTTCRNCNLGICNTCNLISRQSNGDESNICCSCITLSRSNRKNRKLNEENQEKRAVGRPKLDEDKKKSKYYYCELCRCMVQNFHNHRLTKKHKYNQIERNLIISVD
jgi:ribosomal 30S subunit maturation factor RimM